jgi:hypothetical protein
MMGQIAMPISVKLTISFLVLFICSFILLGAQSTRSVFYGQNKTTSVGGGTWSLAQNLNSTTLNCNPTCPSVTVPSTVAGDVILITDYGSNAVNLSSATCSASCGGTWVAPANCNATQATTGEVNCMYAIGVNAGLTSITATLSGSDGSVILNIREYHVTSGTISAETVPAPTLITSGSPCTSCTAPTVTLSGTDDIVISLAATQGTASAIASPFGNFAPQPDGDAIGDHLNTNSGSGGVFTQTSGAATLLSIAFKAQ